MLLNKPQIGTYKDIESGEGQQKKGGGEGKKIDKTGREAKATSKDRKTWKDLVNCHKKWTQFLEELNFLIFNIIHIYPLKITTMHHVNRCLCKQYCDQFPDQNIMGSYMQTRFLTSLSASLKLISAMLRLFKMMTSCYKVYRIISTMSITL